MRSDIYRIIQSRTLTHALNAIILSGLLLIPRVSLGDPPKPSNRSASVVALEVRKEVDSKLSDGLGLKEASETDMTLVLSIPDREVLALDTKGAALTAFTDDRGTNLLAAHPGRLGTAGLQHADISPDGHRAKIVLQSFFAPAGGATKLILKATIPASCGADRKQVRQNEVSLIEGTKFKLGSLEFEVAKSPTQTFADSAMTVQFKCNASLRPIQSLRFLSSSGKEIKSRQFGSTSRRSNNSISETRDFALWENAASIAVEADMFTRTETVQIPVNIEIGVGLGSAASPAK
jgi:hypothetical protein